MPRIRKQTSNRTKTHERKRLQQKVRDGKKKKAKLAKKNPQWKSKQKKDPGIPNNFPFKDQILAEVAEQRRMAADEKQRKKDEKKAKRAADDVEENEEDTFDAVGSIAAKQLASGVTSLPASSSKMQVDEEEDDEEEPLLINRDLPTLQSVLDQADVIVHVLDARDPLSFRSAYLEEWVGSKPGCQTIFVLNKIDLCPRESVSQWLSKLQSEQPTFLFRSASSLLPGQGKGKGKDTLDDAWGAEAILARIQDWAKTKKPSKRPFTVAVVGVTNVGKSSFINSLAQKRLVPIYLASSPSRGATTTEYPHEATIKDIRFIDTPGLMWSHEDQEDRRIRDVLLRNRGRIDRLKDPIPPVEEIVKRSNAEDLMLLYSLAAFAQGNVDSFLAGVARACQLVKKRGELDLTGAARVVLRDWNTLKMVWYTAPSGSASGGQTEDVLLTRLSTRKEMRKAGGLVKLVSGDVDTRKVLIEDSYVGENDSSEDEEEEEEDLGEDEGSGEESESDEEEDDGDSDEEEEPTPPPPPPRIGKQKRKAKAVPESAPAPKKVAFAPAPKGSKQARIDGSSSNKVGKSGQKQRGGEEAYDFGRFF